MTPISVLLKFGSLEHLEELRKGRIYMKPLSYFQELEVDEAKRSDSNEGLLGIFQPDKVNFVIEANGENHELTDLAGPVIFARRDLADIHAFCLFAFTPGEYEVEDEVYDGNQWKVIMDPAMEKFGGHVLCITHPKKFLKRVWTSLANHGKPARSGLIEYISEVDFHGNLPEEKFGFYKFDKYKAQREFRILVFNSGKTDEPISLHVGDLSDITDIQKWNELDIKIKKK